MFKNSLVSNNRSQFSKNFDYHPKNNIEIKSALKVVIPYLTISTLYIVFSDRLTALIAEDFEHITIFQTIKGGGFVLITSIILFIYLQKHFRLLHYEIDQKEKQLNITENLEKNLKLLFENSGEAILLASPDGKIFSANPEACKMFQRSEEDICAIGRKGLVDITDKRIIAALEERSKNGRYKGELIFLRKDGSKFIGDITSTLFTKQDGSICTSVIIRDITERKEAERALKESEERFHKMFEKHNAIMFLIDPDDGKIIDANESAEKFYGYNITQLKNMNIQQINTLPRELIFKEMEAAKESKRTHFIFPHRISSGEIKNVEVYTSPIEIKGKRVLFSINHDITEKIKSDQEVYESREKLRALTAKLEKLKEEERISLAREMHDNLGQRLTALKLDTSWLNRKLSESNFELRDTVLNRIEMISLAMDELIMEVRRISSDLRPNILNFSGLLPTLNWLLKDFEKRTEIKTEFNSKIHQLILDNETSTAVFRIYQEAITNIIRHAKATFVNLTIDELDGKYSIKLCDNGKGIDENKIADRHSLGLIGMKERAISFNAELKIKNNELGGTCVELLIPKK